jgi:MFS family permease
MVSRVSMMLRLECRNNQTNQNGTLQKCSFIKGEIKMEKAPATKEELKKRRRIVGAVGTAQFVDAAEGNIISTLFPSIKETLNLSVGNLGVILSANRILGLIAQPIWAMLADRYSRKMVLVWITGVWGLWTILAGFSGNYQMVLIFTVLSGIGLLANGGTKGSLIADAFPKEERGKALGAIWAIASVGVVIAILIFGPLAEISGLGWRIAYWLFGGLSILSGVIIWIFVDEPVRGSTEAAYDGVSDEAVEELEAKHPFELQKVKAIFKIPTMWVVWLKSIPGEILWVSMVRYGVTWLADERGISPSLAAYALGTLTIGLGLGGILGGRLGDWADRKNPNSGRAVVGQSAWGLAVISALILFLIDWTSVYIYWLLFMLLGFCMQVSSSGSDKPMKLAVVLPEIRATSDGVSGVIATLVNASAALIIGQLGDRLTLTPVLTWSVIGASVFLALIWFAYYITYRKDNVRMQAILVERRADLAIP